MYGYYKMMTDTLLIDQRFYHFTAGFLFLYTSFLLLPFDCLKRVWLTYEDYL